MPSAWFDASTTWISAHPQAAGAVVFLIAFTDALAVVGILIPALPLLFAVGALVGLGHVNGGYAIACAAAGAFAGDGLSYWIGLRWGPQLRGHWPFRRYPQLLERGERVFRRHGSTGILIARFVGPVRPFVPAIAGMLRMPFKRYAPISLFAAATWAVAFLAPGWAFGKSYEAVAAVADRLALVLIALLAALALVWACVLYTWRWFADHANALLERALRWTTAHPRLGRYASALIDPNRPESASLLLLAACLLGISWIWFALLGLVWARGGPLPMDLWMRAAMATLRNPLADRLMAGLATLGDAAVLAPAAGAALLWLLWRRRWIAAAHWLAALAFGLALTAGLDAVVEMPAPAGAARGYDFPAIQVTMATITSGFFAVLIARELPGRARVWPYLLSGVLVTLLGFARLYLGAHWFSDVLGGVLAGIAWLLVLGIAYRRHVARSFWMRPLAIAFYGVLAVAAAWHAPRAAGPTLALFAPAAPAPHLAMADWWQGGWTRLPTRRSERAPQQRWQLDLQVAGPLAPLRRRLLAQGWREQPQADWIATLGLLNEATPPGRQPVLPATLDERPEALLLVRPGARPDERQALRLWPAPVRLEDGTPLWLGTSQTLQWSRPLRVFGLWRPVAGDPRLHADLARQLAGFPQADAVHPDSGAHVLRLRTGPGLPAVPAEPAGF